MTVSIVVDIANRTKDEIEVIRAELASLGRDVNVTIDFETRGFAKALAQKKVLQGLFDAETGRAGGGAGGIFPNLSKKLRGTYGILKRLIPSWHTWITLISVAIPVIVAMSIELFGLAAAWGSVAIAAGAVIGLGLLGWGDSLGESVAHAKRQLSDLKTELYEVFKPTAQAFAPFSGQFLADLPDRLIPVAEAMRGLTNFEGAIDRAFGGLVGWTVEALNGMSEFAPMLDQIAQRFGGLIGTGALNFLEWVTIELYRNQDVLIDLGQTVVYVIAALYNLSKTFSTLLTLLRPVFKFLAWLTHILNEPFVVAALAAAGAMFVMAHGLALLNGLGQASLWANIVQGFALIAAVALEAAAAIWQAIIALGILESMTLIGLVGVLAGVGTYSYMKSKRNDTAPDTRFGKPMGGGSSGGSTNITFNVNGQMDDATRHYIVTKVSDNTP